MYFGRRNKRTSAAESAEPAESETAQFSPVASEERAALMADDPELNAEDSAPVEDNDPEEKGGRDPFESDPTQPLLTSLGRFHREVSRAKDNPAPGWADACMQHLISSVDIAMERGWNDMVATLTETARILQTYDDADRATDAIPFLDESYEILCLMVGNILVGVTRSDSGERWETCYRNALEKLTSAGLTLVRDESESVPATDESTGLPPIDTPEPAEDDVDAEEDFADTAEEEDEDDIPVIGEPVSESTSIDDDSELSDEEAREKVTARALDTYCDTLGLLEAGADDQAEVIGVILDELNCLEEEASHAGRLNAVATSRTMLRLCEQARAMDEPVDDRFFELAYAFCEAYMEGQQGESGSDWIVEAESLLISSDTAPAGTDPAEDESPLKTGSLEDDAASEETEIGPIEEEPAAEKTVEVESDSEPIEDVNSEAEAEAESETDAEDVTGEVEEAPSVGEALAHVVGESFDGNESETEADDTIDEEVSAAAGDEEPDADAAVEADVEAYIEDVDEIEQEPEPLEESTVEVVSEEESTVSRLLAIAQQAASQGDAAQARMLALQVAASIAAEEAEKSATELAQAEQRLTEGADAITTAKDSVAQAEAQVKDSEEAVAEAQKTLDSIRSDRANIENEIEGLETGIAAIEAQIAELQKQRAGENQKLAAERSRLTDATTKQTECESDLEARNAAEEEARRALEDARQQVKANQERRAEFERERDAIQERLMQQQNNAAELDDTIGRFEGKKKDNDEADDNLLFEDV